MDFSLRDFLCKIGWHKPPFPNCSHCGQYIQSVGSTDSDIEMRGGEDIASYYDIWDDYD